MQRRSPPAILTDAAILHGESDVGGLLNIFARSITECAMDVDSTNEVDEANDEDSVVTIDADEAKAKPDKAKPDKAKPDKAKPGKEKPGKAKQASAKKAAPGWLATIADDYDNILAFLQAVAVKSPRVIAAPLSLCVDKRACLVPTLDRC